MQALLQNSLSTAAGAAGSGDRGELQAARRGDAVQIAKASFARSNLAGEQKRRDSLAELLFDEFFTASS